MSCNHEWVYEDPDYPEKGNKVCQKCGISHDMDDTISLFINKKAKELTVDLKHYRGDDLKELAKYMLNIGYSLSDFCDLWTHKQ